MAKIRVLLPAPKQSDFEAVVGLTDNSSEAGNDDDAIEDFTDQVATAGISPAADRDDTRAALAAIKRNLTDVAAKVNELRDAGRGS